MGSWFNWLAEQGKLQWMMSITQQTDRLETKEDSVKNHENSLLL